jgi:hypothetical protein
MKDPEPGDKSVIYGEVCEYMERVLGNVRYRTPDGRDQHWCHLSRWQKGVELLKQEEAKTQ